MPYLSITTNVPMNRKQKELIDLGISKALVIVPKEKPEYLMTHYDDAASMILSGDMAKPCAMIDLQVLAKVLDDNGPDVFEKLLTMATELVGTVLEIDKDRIYATLSTVPLWAAGGLDITKGILK